MKTYDFTKPGGMPFDQNILARMQTAYNEGLIAVAQARGLTDPFVVSGMTQTSGPGAAIADGWFVYNGELIKFSGTSLFAPSVGNVLLIQITVTSTPLTYNDGTTPNVVNEKTATLVQAPSVTDATHFPLGSLTYPKNNSSIISVSAPGTNGLSGTLNYRLNTAANTLQLQGSFRITNGSVTSAHTYTVFGTLPVGCRPNSVAPFEAIINYNGGYVTDAVGNVTKLNCQLDTNGNLEVGVIQASTIPAPGLYYDAVFNLTIPLD